MSRPCSPPQPRCTRRRRPVSIELCDTLGRERTWKVARMSPTEYVGIGLLLLSAVLFLLEVKTAGFGVLGAGGVVALVAGLWLLVAASPFAVLIVLAGAVPVALLFAFLAVLANRARRSKIVTGNAGMIGLEGRCETDLLPEGRVIVRGELWDAVSPVRL